MIQPESRRPQYWDDVDAAATYLLSPPQAYRKEFYLLRRVMTRAVFTWTGDGESEFRSDHAALIWHRDRRFLGLTAARHRLSLAVHLGGEIGVTNLDVDMGQKRITDATFQTMPANEGPDYEHADELFRRAEYTGDVQPSEVTDEHYDLLRRELLRGVIFKSTVLLDQE